MQSTNDMQFGDADGQRLTRLLDHLLDRELEAVRIALLAGERAELAAQDAVVGIVEIAGDDVTGAVAALFLARKIGDATDGVQVLGFEEPQRVVLRNALARRDLVVD